MSRRDTHDALSRKDTEVDQRPPYHRDVQLRLRKRMRSVYQWPMLAPLRWCVTKARLRPARWGAGAVAVLFVALIAVGIGIGADSGWWAAWGQWVGGVGSIIAAWAAVWIAQQGWRRSEVEAQQERASQFALWIENNTRYNRYVLRYHNGTSLPVYEVAILAHSHGEEVACNLDTLPPTLEPQTLRNATNHLMEMFSRPINHINGEQAPGVAVNAGQSEVFRKMKLVYTFRLASRTWHVDAEGRMFSTPG